MSRSGRLFFDITYTQTQRGVTGITRTVWRLFEELQGKASSEGWTCDPVIFHSRGYRRATACISASAETPLPATRRSYGARLFEWVTSRPARAMVLVAVRLLPWAWLNPVWALASSLTFNAQSRAGVPVQFRRGDVLFVADASWNYPCWKAARLARHQGARIIVLVYDLMPLRRPDFCFALMPLQFRTWLTEMLRCSDGVICISQSTQDDLQAWIAEQPVEGASQPPIGHFRLGCDPLPETRPIEVRPSIASFFDSGEPCFAAVGSFEPKKNYPLLLQVFERLWERGQTVRLLLAGRPTAQCTELVENLAHHPELGRRLQVIHDASDAEIQHVYTSCRALLLTSSFEGFGLPLVEARMRGCTVIASDLPAFVELADEGVVIFDRTSDQSLEAVLMQHGAPGTRPAVGRMQPFRWKDSAEQCLAVIASLLESPRATNAAAEVNTYLKQENLRK